MKVKNKDKNRKIIGWAKDLLFPNICICGRWGIALCEGCYDKIKKTKSGLCPICRRLSEYGKTCSSCKGKSRLTGVMIFGDHEGLLKDIVWRYKYEFIKDLSEPLAKLLIEKFGEFIRNKDFLITFVPISRERENWRGYNQSKLIAEGISEGLEVVLHNLLKKLETSPQVGLKKSERLRNIKDKILLDTKIELKNKKVLIVDDVYTTGATLEESANVLRKAGAREVWGIVLSRD